MGRTAIVLGFSIALGSAACNVGELRETETARSDEPGDASAAAEVHRSGGTGKAIGTRAEAVLVDSAGREVGTVTLVQEAEGVRIAVSVDGLEPGRLGFHIHENGRCDAPDFESAGGHFEPRDEQHGAENSDGPHAGDLPNLRVGPDGHGENETLNPLLSLSDGVASLTRQGGTSVIIHEGTDDYYTDPSGDAGARIACGVIRGRGNAQTG